VAVHRALISKYEREEIKPSHKDGS